MEWSEFRSHIRHLSAADQERVKHAFDHGSRAHEGQVRKSGEPYFTHPIAVADMLADMGADADTIIAAFLHDTIEDTPLKLEDIERDFGKGVATLVDGVTKLEESDVAAKPTLDEQIETLRKMFTLMQKDVRIIVIKLVDRLHNMQTAQHLSEEKRTALAEETMDVYVKIADRLCMQDLRDELESLCLQILEPDVLDRMVNQRHANEKQGEKVIRSISKTLHESHPSLTNNITLQYENKSWTKLRIQVETEGTAVTGVSALTAVFICKDVETCYRVFGALHQQWNRETMSFQDFINAPMINGYEGLHTTIILEDGTRVRCKIRTKEMHEYARRGVTTKCFDSAAVGLLEYLPWAERIKALSEDTVDRSEDFWTSLQSDILGESIVIHGRDDRTLSLPKGSTALDGAFYIYREEALSVTAIRVNGKEVPFSTPLMHAASIDVTLGAKQTVERGWLHWVETGFAKAFIRSALGSQTNRELLQTGQTLLQQALTEGSKGYIEEFNLQRQQVVAHHLGYSSLNEVYRAITDGHLDPRKVAQEFVRPIRKQRKHSSKHRRVTLRFTSSSGSSELLQRIATNCKEHNVSLLSIQARHDIQSDQATIKMTCLATNDQTELLIRALESINVINIENIRQSSLMALLTATTIFFWALNPVFAKWFLTTQDVSPLELLTLRSIAFGLFTCIAYAVWRVFTQKKFVSLPNATRLSIIPALATVLLAWFTYHSLMLMPPSVHLTILRFNVLLIPLIQLLPTRKKFRISALLTSLCTIAGIGAIALLSPDVMPRGIAFACLALVTYISYSLITEHILQKYKIGARYPSFLFHVGLLVGIMGIVLAVVHRSEHLWSELAFPVVLYVFLCVYIPHVSFHLVLRQVRFKYITDIFLLEVPLAALFETLWLGLNLQLGTYLLVAIVLGSIPLFRWYISQSDS